MRSVLLTLVAVLAGCTATRDAAPVEREAWGAAPAVPAAMPPMGPVRHVVVHHTATEVREGQGEPGHVEGIQTFHQGERGWGDVAYHWLVGPSGAVYRGRAEAFAPASGTVYLTDTQRDTAGQDALGHSAATVPVGPDGAPAEPPGASAGHLTISVIGDYTDRLPSPEARDALVGLVAERLHAHGLNVEDVRFHREVAVGTVCPGQALYDWFRGPDRRDGARGPGLRQVEAALAALRAE